ncbi:amino acid transporter protein [Methylobacterium sp. NPDC080182]|uniref:amino acid transporter protein n=1 Tax=Methylobacterium sp. NPDC080182 TaxID=3390590 RepID=UPI003D00E09C
MSDEAEADKKLIANEQSKLTATYANGIAIAVFAVGGLAPLVSALAPKHIPYGPTPVISSVPPGIVGITVFCWIVSGALHWAARGYLKDLRA